MNSLKKDAAKQGKAVKRLLGILDNISPNFIDPELFDLMIYSRAKLAAHYALEYFRKVNNGN